MIQILAIVFLLLWIGFKIFYSVSEDWFGDTELISRTLGAICWACLTALAIYLLVGLLLLLIYLGMGVQ